MENYFNILTHKQYQGIKFIVFNYDNVRPAGERLKTFGGYASGEGAIREMFTKIAKLLSTKREEQWVTLKPIDALDIATMIAENVISGGVRRSSLIVFCDDDDDAVIKAKEKIYTINNEGYYIPNATVAHRMLSNNTIVYKNRPTRAQLHEHFKSIRFTGEPKILGSLNLSNCGKILLGLKY